MIDKENGELESNRIMSKVQNRKTEKAMNSNVF